MTGETLLLVDQRTPAEQEQAKVQPRLQALAERIHEAREVLAGALPDKGLSNWWWSCELQHALGMRQAINEAYPLRIVPN